MGKNIQTDTFCAEDYQRFSAGLSDNLAALKQLLARPDFGLGQATIGAELELYLVDYQGRPLCHNKEVISRCENPRFALELNRFNLEYNLTPVVAAGRPFSLLEHEMCAAIKQASEQLLTAQSVALPIGILPTLKRRDFGLHAITHESRFYALTAALKRLRGGMFCIKIDGEPTLSLRSHDVSLEGANSSMQVHLRVTPAEFADTFNALQLATPIALALAANSPFMLGHKLWHETRIPLFRQAIDGRSHEERERALPSRVDFGNGWVRTGAYELFAEAVRLYEPILPESSDEDALQVVAAGGCPQLHELCLHMGTVWPWNRAVFDAEKGRENSPTGNGHLRIEMRALPAGPTSCDMLANMAFALGLAEGLKGQINEIIPALPFATLAHNFYLAAEKGINAQLMWPDLERTEGVQKGLQKRSVLEIAAELLPVARSGLAQLGVDDAEGRHYLGIMATRIEQGITGAVWQRREYQRLLRKMPAPQALTQMVQRYMYFSAQNIPLAHWGNRGAKESI